MNDKVGDNEQKIPKTDKLFVDTCFLPDQYAIQWAWAGNGQLQSYDPITGVWTEWGQTIDPATGAVVGGYALAFKNDAVDPVIYFQRSGKLYKADPADPINTFQLVGATLPAAPSSYPCFAFDPSGRLLAGIASGSTVVEIDPTTGAATNIGSLIDARDGANLQAGPGDWYFDPNGDWFLMATDPRAGTFGEPCSGTVLWKIDSSTLETVRVSEECSTIGGTGAEWLAAGLALLSHSNGTLSQYNTGSGEWTAFPNPAPNTINDLSAQWIIPEPIKVFGFVEKDKPIVDQCESCLYTMVQNETTLELECQPFTLKIPGTFGKCEADSNPFVSDPFDPAGGDSGPKNPDQVWNEGCSDAGTTMFRTSCDDAGNEFTEYLYGTLQEPTSLKPVGFRPVSCSIAQAAQTETTQWCNNDETPAKSIFRKESSSSEVTWFDEDGEQNEPINATPGACPDLSPLLPVSEQVICADGVTAIRRVSEQYIENADGLPELSNTQVIWFNETGTIYDSGVLQPTDAAVEPAPFYFGDCVNPYRSVEFRQMCEVDARFLLLIDSGGVFGRYSFYSKTWEPVTTLSVASAGGSADVVNFRLYNFVAPDQMTVIDVNTDTQLPSVTLTSGVLNPAVAANPLTFSAASFRDADGYLYAWDTGGADAGLYKVNVTTGAVDFVTTISGVAGAGTSIAIDNTTDTLVIAGSNLSYNVDWVTGAGTIWNNPPTQPNGSTFDTSGNYYVTAANNTYMLPAGADGNDPDSWVLLIDDFTAGANSLAYYEVVAPEPSCFYRKFGILDDPLADPVYLSDHNVADFSPRTIVGDVTCCDTLCHCGDSGSTDPGATSPTAQQIADAMVTTERARTSGRLENWQNEGGTVSLDVPAGTLGCIRSITEYGTGAVYWTIDGTVPSAANGSTMSVQYGPNIDLCGVDLSLVRLDGSSNNSDFSISYEVWT